MNVFVLDRDPVLAAKYHCDKHVNKMIIESAQILSQVHHRKGTSLVNHVCKPFQPNGRFAIWAEEPENYLWLWRLGYHLMFEYASRFSKAHSMQGLYGILGSYGIVTDVTAEPKSFVRAFGDYEAFCRQEDIVDAYRKYYRLSKFSFAKWKHTKEPFWWRAG